MSRYLKIALLIASLTTIALFTAGFPWGPG